MCFTVPAMVNHQVLKRFSLVIEPSVSLIQEQVQNLCNKGVDAISLGSPAGKEDRLANYQRLLEGNIPVMVYCTPEYLFGPHGAISGLESVFREKLSLVVIDEAHKAIDRSKGFRDAYDGLYGFASKFHVPYSP